MDQVSASDSVSVSYFILFIDMFVSRFYDVVGFSLFFNQFFNLQPLTFLLVILFYFIFSFITFEEGIFSFCCLPLNHLKEKTHTCCLVFIIIIYLFLYAGACNFCRLQ